MKIALIALVVLLGAGVGAVAGSQGFPKASPTRTVTTPARTITLQAAIPKPKPKPKAKPKVIKQAQMSTAEQAQYARNVAKAQLCNPQSEQESIAEGERNREAVEREEPEPCPPVVHPKTLGEIQATQEAESEERRSQAREEECLAKSGVAGC